MDLPLILSAHAKWLANPSTGSRADLSGANLRGADLSRANLSRADLSSANLSRADLSRADLSSANLRGANLHGADLSGANLCRADLCRADLSGANLRGANLSRANLSSANLSSANLCRAHGLLWASVSFTGHGERGRMLTAVVIGTETRFFCGCFSGTLAELRAYIKRGAACYHPSRRLALSVVRKLLAVPKA